MESEDDFYGEQRGEDVDRLERERDIVKLERIHVATGFRDSAESSRDAHLQCGFDSGFLDGAAAVAPAAFWMGVAAVLEAKCANDGQINTSLRRARMDARNRLRALDVNEKAPDASAAEAACRASGFSGRATYLEQSQ